MTPQDEMKRAVEVAREVTDFAAEFGAAPEHRGRYDDRDTETLARALLAAHAEIERVRPVYRAALKADGCGNTHYAGCLKNRPCALCELSDAIDEALTAERDAALDQSRKEGR